MPDILFVLYLFHVFVDFIKIDYIAILINANTEGNGVEVEFSGKEIPLVVRHIDVLTLDVVLRQPLLGVFSGTIFLSMVVACPVNETNASRRVMIVDLCIIRFALLEFLFQPVQIGIEVVVAVEVEVIAHTAAIGRDGLVVRNAVETEQLLHTGEVGVGKTDGFFVGKPFLYIVMIGLAALGRSFTGDKDEFDIVAFGNLCPQFFTVLDS